MTNPNLWTSSPSVSPAYIEWFQTGKTPIGSAFDAYTTNPYEDKNAVKIPFVISRRGLEFVPAGRTTVWLFFRVPYPGLGMVDWDLAITYFQGDPVLFNGDTYHSLVDGNLGQSPDLSSSFWSLFRIPYVLSRFVYKAAYSDTLIVNGQNEKAPVEEC